MQQKRLFRSEHICKLYGLTNRICKDRLPDTLPGQTCCHDCTNTSCKRRCLNTPEKCGKSHIAICYGSRWTFE